MIFGTPEHAQLLKDVIESKKRHPLYEDTVKHAEEMSVHIYGDRPYYLLERVRPREEEEVKSYRIENYEPTTKAGADKAIDIVSKIFNPTLYSIRWKDQNSQIDELKSYTFDYYPNYNSLVTYNKDVVLRKMLADPNGVMAVKPGAIPEDQAERIEPEVVIYGSPNVWYYDKDHFLIFHHEETEDSKKIFYFDYYDKENYYHFNAWYDASNKQVVTVVIDEYPHGFKEIPAWLLRGKSRQNDNGSIVYESFFSPALAHWNLAVIHESDLLGAYINHMHPLRYELSEECNYKFTWEDGVPYPCRGGTIKYGPKDKSYSIDCPSCLGSGYKAPKSPYGVYQFDKKKLSEGDNIGGLQPAGFITVPVEATKLLEERTREMNKKALWAINMDVEDEVGENQSGVAKVIDRSGQQDTIFNIGSVIFDIHLPNQYYFINKYMFETEAKSTRKEENKNLPEINKPTIIDILTVSDLINNFHVAKTAGVDKNVLRLKQIEIINRDPSLVPEQKAYMVALVDLDPLFGYPQNEIDLGVNKGVIRKIDWTIHENLKPFLDRALEEDQDFLNRNRSEKVQKLEEYANELIEGEQPRLDEAMLIKEESFAA
jgi:hypothetical protein